MDDTRWRQYENLFHTLTDVPAGPARESRLVALCEGDHELAAAVRSLLLEDERFEAADPPADPHLGLRLGSYQIDRLLARGGMAAVYEAHRADDQFHQRVAVKIMDLRLSDATLVAQFRGERQILAALEHPALTRLLDGGVTGLGEPYLVMEYVDGQPIDRYCDQRRLDVAGRLRLFEEVCEGVDFAHRNLVLHRDLKPANVLVTDDGHVKVVDFGTATLLQPERLMTMSPAPLTPAYASPEQLTGQAVGTASDQYSLGLILYELLTGVAPFASRASLMAAIERALAGVEPTAPHVAVTEAAVGPRRTSMMRLRRLLAGDLGTIVRKALSVAPAARYASVQHLADDLQRWTAGEPILGRTPSVAYRSSRFVRRHWVAASLAAALLSALVASTAVSFQQASIARQQAALASTESAKARQLNRFLTQMLSSANPSWSNANAASAGSITVRQVLDGAGQLIASELGTRPEVEAEMRRTIGRTYLGLGAFDQAVPHLDRALVLFREHGDEVGVAFTQELLGNYRVQRGEFKEGEALLRQAVAHVRSRGDLADPELRQIAIADLGAAIAYQHPGHPEALALMRESIGFADRSGLNPGLAAVVMHNLGLQLTRLGRIDEAEETLREAIRRMDALPSALPEANSALRSLATLLLQRGEYVEAERLAAAAAEGAARTRPPDHPLQPNFKAWWGRALVAVGDLERGRTVLLDAYAGYRKIRPPGHMELALPLIGLGAVSRLQGQLHESERLLREARAILQRNPAQKDRAADAAGELGLTLRLMGRTEEADALLEESHGILHDAFGPEHPLTRQASARLSPTR